MSGVEDPNATQIVSFHCLHKEDATKKNERTDENKIKVHLLAHREVSYKRQLMF